MCKVTDIHFEYIFVHLSTQTRMDRKVMTTPWSPMSSWIISGWSAGNRCFWRQDRSSHLKQWQHLCSKEEHSLEIKLLFHSNDYGL